ncbi:hypothetical protein Rhopal_007677-T1 [Rhodotorula paludigena]|uniref:Uncharacterized protein n=1 Tax=Rhodotorula paludigena TaxID=86838 RepID=A0AAV5GZF2_9BASI|nr:hypothetical protein Rhopal_007677-T1 [Rhodotorula paludigena]
MEQSGLRRSCASERDFAISQARALNLLLERGVVEEAELKKIDKEARAVVEKAVEEAKDREMRADVSYAGTNPVILRGLGLEEVHHFEPLHMRE